MKFLRLSIVSCSCAVLLAAVAGPAIAANLLTNPNFDTAVTPGWTPFFGASWDNTKDFGGGTGGSLLGSQGSSVLADVVRQCVSPVAPGAAYSLGAKVWVNTGFTGGWIAVTWYPSASCAGAAISTSSGQTVSTTGGWNDSLPPSGNPITSPGTAASAMVAIVMSNTFFGGNGRANFDNTFFGPGTFPVELQSFEVK